MLDVAETVIDIDSVILELILIVGVTDTVSLIETEGVVVGVILNDTLIELLIETDSLILGLIDIVWLLLAPILLLTLMLCVGVKVVVILIDGVIEEVIDRVGLTLPPHDHVPQFTVPITSWSSGVTKVPAL